MAASLASMHLGRNNLQKGYSTAKAPPTRPDQGTRSLRLWTSTKADWTKIQERPKSSKRGQTPVRGGWHQLRPQPLKGSRVEVLTRTHSPSQQPAVPFSSNNHGKQNHSTISTIQKPTLWSHADQGVATPSNTPGKIGTSRPMPTTCCSAPHQSLPPATGETREFINLRASQIKERLHRKTNIGREGN